jgi:4'-phosphopantetheinyl transferase
MPGVGLWLIDITASAARDVWFHLSELERQRSTQFLHIADRHRFTVVRGSLKKLLGDLLGVDARSLEFQYTADGKPFLPSAQRLTFNASHAGDYGLIAVSRAGPVGVDIDLPRSSLDVVALAREFFAPSEYNLVATSPPALRDSLFLRMWTYKEALTKAAGASISRSVGLALPDEVLATLQHAALADPNWQTSHFRLFTISLPEPYLGAVALRPELLRREYKFANPLV